jgi:hypothetical protein
MMGWIGRPVTTFANDVTDILNCLCSIAWVAFYLASTSFYLLQMMECGSFWAQLIDLLYLNWDMACMIWVQSQFCILVLHFFVLCYFVWYIILGWQELQLNWGYWFLHTLALLEFCEHYYWVYKYVQWCFNLFIHQFYWGINHVQWCFITSYYTTRGSRHMAWCFIIKQAHAFAVFMLYNDDCYSYMPMLMMFTCILTESLLNKPMHLLFSCCTMMIIILTCLCQWCFLKLSTCLCQWCFFKKTEHMPIPMMFMI